MTKNHKITKLLVASLAGFAATMGYACLLRPRMLSWGANPDELSSHLPGDELIPDRLTQTTRAIDILAPKERVWPWIIQIGQGRGGFYSYDWLENAFGLDIHSADQILPEYQKLVEGDLIPFWSSVGVTVRQISPPEFLVLAGSFDPKNEEVGGSWTFFLKETGPTQCRLLIRTRIAAFHPRWFSQLISFKIIEPAHFVMERGMLFGIKQRAEKAKNHQKQI